MIDRISIRRTTNEKGREFEQVRLWIAGIPFQTDNSPHVERVIRKLASENSIELFDARTHQKGDN